MCVSDFIDFMRHPLYCDLVLSYMHASDAYMIKHAFGNTVHKLRCVRIGALEQARHMRVGSARDLVAPRALSVHANYELYAWARDAKLSCATTLSNCDLAAVASGDTNLLMRVLRAMQRPLHLAHVRAAARYSLRMLLRTFRLYRIHEQCGGPSITTTHGADVQYYDDDDMDDNDDDDDDEASSSEGESASLSQESYQHHRRPRSDANDNEDACPCTTTAASAAVVHNELDFGSAFNTRVRRDIFHEALLAERLDVLEHCWTCVSDTALKQAVVRIRCAAHAQSMAAAAAAAAAAIATDTPSSPGRAAAITVLGDVRRRRVVCVSTDEDRAARIQLSVCRHALHAVLRADKLDSLRWLEDHGIVSGTYTHRHYATVLRRYSSGTVDWAQSTTLAPRILAHLVDVHRVPLPLMAEDRHLLTHLALTVSLDAVHTLSRAPHGPLMLFFVQHLSSALASGHVAVLEHMLHLPDAPARWHATTRDLMLIVGTDSLPLFEYVYALTSDDKCCCSTPPHVVDDERCVHVLRHAMLVGSVRIARRMLAHMVATCNRAWLHEASGELARTTVRFVTPVSRKLAMLRALMSHRLDLGDHNALVLSASLRDRATLRHFLAHDAVVRSGGAKKRSSTHAFAAGP